MKGINYIKNMFILAGICIFCSCDPYKYQKITIAIDDTCNLEQQSAAYEVINKRFASMWYVKERTGLVDGKFELTYSDPDSLLVQMLTQKGEIYIIEVYLNNEIQASVCKVYDRLIELARNTGHELLWRTSDFQNGHDPLLIDAPLQQVAFIDSVFNSYKHFFPADISFAWMTKSRDGFFELLALKSTSQPFPLNPRTVKNSNVDKGEHHPVLAVELNEKYHKEWARMTRDNISRNLAIVMDGKVLMYPRVQCEITGGKLTITNDFDINELRAIRSIILSGTLDSKVQIINRCNLQ